MFKINIPLTVLLSSGSLTLLAIGSLLLASNTAYTSDIQIGATKLQSNNEFNLHDNPALADPMQIANSSVPVLIRTDAKDLDQESQQAGAIDSRRRSGRAYGQSYGSNQQQSSLDSYAAALAAANAPNSPDQSSSGLAQSSVQADDANSFASFGESLPSPNPGASITAGRQLSGADYGASQYPASSAAYYAGYMAPSSNAATYSSTYGNTNGQSATAANYHSSPVHRYSQYNHKAASPPLGYPTNNNYDYQSTSSNYYDRPYMNAASTPIWASGLPSSGSSGLMSSASSALSHWTGGFGLAEIICSIVAIAIGAIILGAPFFLIYLALMGNFSGSGTLSLTNPTQGATPAGGASTTTNGRRKRLAIFEQLSSLGEKRHVSGSLAEALISQLSPFVDLQQVSSSFKQLVESVERYSNMKPEVSKKTSS